MVVVPIQDPANYRRVQERIRKLWEEGDVEILPHAVLRMKERKIEITDVYSVIRYGRVIEHSKPGDLWRYVVEGKTVEGAKAGVVVEIDGTLMVVTVRR
jgi:Domain of unknown function (DUF4258)